MGKKPVAKTTGRKNGRPAPAIAEVVYDDSARRDYLTGFHKRKLEKKKAAIERHEARVKEERRELRKENNKRHLIVDDLERIEAVTQEQALDSNAHKERTVDVATIPSETRITTVTISDWNPEDADEEEERHETDDDDEMEEDGGEGGEKEVTVKKNAPKAKSAAAKPRSALKKSGVSKVRTKANPHMKRKEKDGKKGVKSKRGKPRK
ncbi:nucleolar protein 12-domain-containing protein [Fimicolochytrium jonesii]|uniref:nucleolar protein 12-domain-containing protein n=1 Tax=Fimicolochytrium jonesii TaxID=1396493 RepID=UPI0022FDCEE2|nr:nucleolar protein 12-domain-containing protein [Fimicolochytrium jonesii]KAI8820819.1 nucleolar protein 12-domain-containing protein [Fimicolochytrium jonesii]